MGKPAFALTAATTLGSHLGKASDPAFVVLPALKQLPTETPIFLDTNVLLGYYQMPMAARSRFQPWLASHPCYAANQVQREFKRHAQKLQRLHRRHLQAPIVLARLSDSAAAVRTYVQREARLLRDYPSWQRYLYQLLAEAEALTQYAEQYNERYLKQGHALLRQANAASPFELVQPLSALSKRAFKHLRQEFDHAASAAIKENNKGFDDAVAAYQYRYPTHVFPGLGDVLNKQKDPYGDYLIYHEIVQWAAQDSGHSPILFLTNDSTKGDWITASGAPYSHYQQHFLAQTGRVLHIAAARPLLQTWLGVDPTPLLLPREAQEDVEKAIWAKNARTTVQPIPTKTVHSLLGQLWPDRVPGGESWAWQELQEYLAEATPYQSVFQLEGQLLQFYPQLLRQELEAQRSYTQLEALQRSVHFDFAP